MKLTVFQSGKGDCLLLTGEDGRTMLADGGQAPTYSEHVAPALGRMRAAGKSLDLVYLSHIDDDHIGGVLRLMDDEVEWRVHDFQVKSGNAGHRRPRAPRPPRVKAIWHNAFHDQLGKNTGEVENMLAASAAILSGSDNGLVKALASRQGELATSVAQALRLSRRVSPEQLGIKLNPPAKGRLMMVRAGRAAPVRLGGMRLWVIGPFPEDLRELRKEWNEWLRTHRKQLKSIQRRAEEDERAFGVKEISDIIVPKLRQAEALSSLLPLAAAGGRFKLGQRQKVTTPNLASLMLYVEEERAAAGGRQTRTLLLTGDGHQDDIVRGLRHTGKLAGGGGLHVNVLKVQHHGSEHNIDEEFCRLVTADNYLFCGNGEHENPDLRVLQAIADSRIGARPGQRSPNPEAGDRFKFLFNSSPASAVRDEAKAHMREVKKLVGRLEARSKGQMSSSFLDRSSFDLTV